MNRNALILGFFIGAASMCGFYLAMEKLEHSTVKAAIEQEGDRLTAGVSEKLERIEAAPELTLAVRELNGNLVRMIEILDTIQ